MRIKPNRFVGHKIGPFENIELSWERESRSTLIVAENGMGKTTLVATIAYCLALNGNNLSGQTHQFVKKAFYDSYSFAYLELLIDGEIGWILAGTTRKERSQEHESLITQLTGLSNSDVYGFFRKRASLFHQSKNYYELHQSFVQQTNVKAFFAAYGVWRNLRHVGIQGYQELQAQPISSVLDPFAEVVSQNIFQWVANQHINYALAIADEQNLEAKSYLETIHRIEKYFSEFLAFPLSFKVERNPFRIEIKQNGSSLTIEQLSDGTRSLLSWMVDCLMRASRLNWSDPEDSINIPGIILVDEIDAHLHPEWQKRVMSFANELLPQSHIIATTHSPFVLGATDDAQVFHIYRDEDGNLQAKSSFDELYGYPADLILEKTFVPSLYPPETEAKMNRLSDLARMKVAGTASREEKREYDELTAELSTTNPWLSNLLALSQATEA